MILKGRYDEIMEKITLTPESRARILENIRGMDLSSSGEKSGTPYWKRMMPVAAMAALVLTGVIAWQWWSKPVVIPDTGDPSTEVPLSPGDEDPGGAQTTVREAQSAAELETLMGFPVDEPSGLPFAVERTVYKAYWYGMAEVTAAGEGHSAKLRKQPGEADVSGTAGAEYPAMTEIEVGGAAVSLKGIQAGDRYNIAVWEFGGYSYSLELSGGADADTFASVIRATVPGMEN